MVEVDFMKKRALAMIFALVFILAGCSESEKVDNAVQKNEDTQVGQVEDPGAISGKQEEVLVEETEDPVAESEPDTENFTTKMNSAELREINLFQFFSIVFFDITI